MYASKCNLGHLFMLHKPHHKFLTQNEFRNIKFVTKILFVRLNINNGRQIWLRQSFIFLN